MNTHKRTLIRGPLALLAAFVVLGACWSPPAHAAPTAHNVSAGLIQVDQIPGYDPYNPPIGGDENTNAIYTLPYSFNDFHIGTYNRADVNIRIGASATGDSLAGILISAVSQNVRTNYGTNSYPITMIETNSGNSFRIATHQSGTISAEDNVNVAAAYFPYSTWIGGHARSEPYGNGFTNNLFTGSPGLKSWREGGAYTNYTDLKETLNLGGRSSVDLRNFGIDSRRDGVLLVNHGKDRAGDGNYAVSAAQADGTWQTWVRDHGGGSENDPVAFVFIPKTNTTVISGRFLGNATIDMYSGTSPQFTVTNLGSGRWILTIPGHAATNGVLIMSGEGFASQNSDNVYTYEATPGGDAYEIHSRDLPEPFGLQTPGSGNEPIVDFVYIPGPTPGITVTPTANLQTTESGGTAAFTVVLDTKPTADVTIPVSSSNIAEGLVSTDTLTFTAANWETPQTVTITGQDDAVKDGAIAYTIVLGAASSADASYQGKDAADVSVINADNEAGVTVSKASLTTTEAGGQDTFTVVLNTAPTDNVTIGLSSSVPTEGTVSPASLTFTPADWSTPQTVTVTGVNDAKADGNVAYAIITAAATSTDTAYGGVNPLDVAAVNLDDDRVGFTFNPTSLTVAESNSVSFTAVLASQPAADVTLSLSASDATEGSVSPASRTFTSANWATPQTFTLSGVDDFVNDGSISYTINGTVSSGDGAYAALTPVIAATTTDNEAALTLPSGTLVYGAGLPAQGIDGQATLIDPDTANYRTGSLTVTITANPRADDRLGIRNTGTGAGQIGVAGSVLIYGGINIGTFSGGVGTAPLVITFTNVAATPDAAQALVRNVTYYNVSATPSFALRTVTFVLNDAHGGTASASKNIQVGLIHVSDFQDGVDAGWGPYYGEADAELNGSNVVPTSSGGSYPSGSTNGGIVGIQISWVGGIDNCHALLRFDSIIGDAPGQVPTNAMIVSADLILNVPNAGDGSPLYRMLIPWDAENSSWDSTGGGMQRDDFEAKSTFESQIGVADLSGATTTGTIKVSVVPDVQAWVNGEPNYGWVMPGWDFNADNTLFRPSEWTNVVERPRLRVAWVPAGTPMASFRQNVDSYTGAHDTRLREAEADTDASQITSLFVDAEVNSGKADPEEVLMRFEDIVGTGTGQIPSGAFIHSAVLDLGSTIGNAMGDGGKVYAMLRSWQDTDTWNTLVSGIYADGIEAAVTPTFTAGSPTLNPDVQGAYLTFDVTPDVQAWVNGTLANRGWVFLPWPAGGNGWGFASAEATTERDRPRLRVYYSVSVSDIIILDKPVRNPSNVQLSFSGTIGRTYSILRAPSVTTPLAGWSSIGTATVGSNGAGAFTDNSPLPGTAYYRVVYP